jgi:nucleoside-diphosphate-sugar epimerase
MSPQPPHTVIPSCQNKKLFCFGYGYTARSLAQRLMQFGWTIAGTTTDPEKKDAMQKDGIASFLFEKTQMLADPHAAFDGVTHMLFSIPPNDHGDPVLEAHAPDIAAIKTLEWAGYLSTTAVYGNQDGGWVDESSSIAPESRRGDVRARAEQQWQSMWQQDALPLHIFRLAGIYGPERNVLDSVRAGTARRIEKPGHVFNRIHVEDIVQTLIASMNKPRPGGIYNLADDVPTPSHEVINFACNLLGINPPPLLRFDQVELAPIVRSFYKDNKRVNNGLIKSELGVKLLYPDFRAGLQACFEIETRALGFLDFGKTV